MTQGKEEHKSSANTFLFVGSMNENLYALDARSGRCIWQYNAEGWVETTPAVTRGILVGTSFSLKTGFMQIFCLEAMTGKKLWAIEPEWGETTSVAIYDSLVLVGSRQDGKLNALSLQNGNEIWSFRSGGDAVGTPVISGGLVFIGSNDLNIYAIEAMSGRKVWERKIESELLCSPAATKDHVIFGCLDGYVYALGVADGNRVWSFQTGDKITSPVAISNDRVFVGSQDTKLYTLDLHSGKKVWEFETGDLVSGPAIWRDTVIIGSWGIYAMEVATGKRIWSFEKDILTIAAPVIWDNLVFVVTDNLHALQTNSGKIVWKTDDIGVLSSPSLYEVGKLEWPMFRGNPRQTGIGIESPQ
jgi:outer membrane protein assembly factor BamB